MKELLIHITRNRLALAGLIVVVTLFGAAIAAPIIAPYNYKDIDVSAILLPPTIDHLFGTDDLGRDVFSRMLWGARISLAVGFVAVG
ncbi:MAG: peptide ABC transporter permease, partial [Deltaproteobacteria bacterium]|nr:peptide ABC transporter permease [Deltaproteobacteria bacterium]